MNLLKLPPISLYVHIPWCIKKCPYCDFNSHTAISKIPEVEYVNALLKDLEFDSNFLQGRKIESIFFGGGTPSLFSAYSFERIINGIEKIVPLNSGIEITMEANPGTFEHEKFKNYFDVGINRLSLGVQSFNDDKLKKLGRIHSAKEAKTAIESLKKIGWNNFNIDIMHGLPSQNIDDALQDLEATISFNPTHISWYQMTIEPNTVFFSDPPIVPVDEILWDIQQQGNRILKAYGYHQYEISAYSKKNYYSKHNLNYWKFGDYLGIGAGAHGKITMKNGQIYRNQKTRVPKNYLNSKYEFEASRKVLNEKDLILEFMMNALRLNAGVNESLFFERTGLQLSILKKSRKLAIERGLMEKGNKLRATEKGLLFLNNLLTECFNI